MTNNGHHNEQFYSQGASHAGAGADGRVRGFGMGNAGQPDAQSGSASQAGYAGRVPQTNNPNGVYVPPSGQAYGMPAGVPQPPQVVYVQPATSQAVPMKKRRSKGFWAAIIIAIICVVVAVALAFFMLNPDGASKRAGSKGQLEGKTPEEIQAELNRQVEEGMFNISIASTVEFQDGTSEGELRIENVPGNHYLMKVDITRDDNGQTIYTSDYLEPDYHIQRDTLDVDLPAGTYPCTAVFTASDIETEDMVGQAAAKVTVNVLS